MKWMAVLAAFCWCATAQQSPPNPADPASPEMQELRRGIAEANTSEIEVLRFIEHYLSQHPDTAFRPDLEFRAAQAAIAIHDSALIVRYGEASLARVPDNTKLMPAVTRALLALNTRDGADHALKLARRSEELARQMQKDGNPGDVPPVEWRNRTDRLLSLALVDDARATGILGRPEEALAIAQRAFETYPAAGAAREIAFWYERLGKRSEAIRALSDAFTIPDTQTTDGERAQDREHLGELYRKEKGSEEGLGALCLEAFDRNAARLKARDLRLHQGEPNAGRRDPMEFTLSAVDGKALAMASLKGKVVVLDLWATWCIPCREQHPLYQQVKERFRDNPSVVLLSIDADAEHAPVKSFLSQNRWDGPVYFEDGLARAFGVEGIPATIVIDRAGKLFTHLNGFDTQHKEHFVELLTERIRDALAVPAN